MARRFGAALAEGIGGFLPLDEHYLLVDLRVYDSLAKATCRRCPVGDLSTRCGCKEHFSSPCGAKLPMFPRKCGRCGKRMCPGCLWLDRPAELVECWSCCRCSQRYTHPSLPMHGGRLTLAWERTPSFQIPLQLFDEFSLLLAGKLLEFLGLQPAVVFFLCRRLVKVMLVTWFRGLRHQTACQCRCPCVRETDCRSLPAQSFKCRTCLHLVCQFCTWWFDSMPYCCRCYQPLVRDLLQVREEEGGQRISAFGIKRRRTHMA